MDHQSLLKQSFTFRDKLVSKTMAMKLSHYLLLLAVGLANVSCDRHKEIQRQVSALESTVKRDREAVALYIQNINNAGGDEGLIKMRQQIEALQNKTRLLEVANTANERKWADIEAKFAKLKPAAEAYKAAHSR